MSFTPMAGTPLNRGGPNLNPSRLITIAYIVVLTVLGIVAGGLFFDAHAVHRQLEQTNATLTRTLAEAEEQLREQKVVLERLRTDPAYVDKVIRQRLNYAKPDDYIFRFK